MRVSRLRRVLVLALTASIILPAMSLSAANKVPALGGAAGAPKIINIPAKCLRDVQPSNWPWVPYWWIVQGCPDYGPLLALARDRSTEVKLPGAKTVILPGAAIFDQQGKLTSPSPVNTRRAIFDRWGNLATPGIDKGIGKIINIPAKCLRDVQPSNWPWVPFWWIVQGCPDDGPMLALVRARTGPTKSLGSFAPWLSRLEAIIRAWQLGVACVVGDTGPGGGTVFYVSPIKINVQPGISAGGYCLEAAPKTWAGTASGIDPTLKWGCYPTTLIGTGGGVGTGASNTKKITTDCTTAGIAAERAASLSLGSKTDWFLPSWGELDLMYTNLVYANMDSATQNPGGFVADYYWSSTQGQGNNAVSTNSRAWTQNLDVGSGSTLRQNKNISLSVRPIRAFG